MMAVDSTGWDGVLAAACDHADRGHKSRASQLLAGLLQALDPATATPDHLVLTVAALYATVTEPGPEATGGRPDAVAWARYAVEAAQCLHGRYHPNTVNVTELLASVLSARGHRRAADEVWQQLMQLHRDHGAVSDSCFARLELAWQRHDRGQCRDAEQIWQAWTTRFGGTGRLSALIAVQVGGMLRACGRATEAQPYLERADRHIPGRDDPRRTAYATYLLAFWVMAVGHAHTCRQQ